MAEPRHNRRGAANPMQALALNHEELTARVQRLELIVGLLVGELVKARVLPEERGAIWRTLPEKPSADDIVQAVEQLLQ